MAEDTKEIHYLVGVADQPVAHIHATDQKTAVKEFVQGANEYGYDSDEYDGEDVIVVAFSKVDVYLVEIVPPTDPQLTIEKVKRLA